MSTDRIAELEAIGRERSLTAEESVELEVLISDRNGTPLLRGTLREATRFGWRRQNVGGRLVWRRKKK